MPIRIPAMYPRSIPKAVIFDWDNTLVDSSFNILHSINIVFEKFNMPALTMEEFKKQPAIPVKKYFIDLLGVDGEKKAGPMFFDAFSKNHLLNLQPLPGTHELLDFLQSEKIPAGIVSNKEGGYLRREVSHMGWDKHFPHVIGCDDTAESKPSALPLLTLLERAKIDPGYHVWFVGDSPIDMLCAHNARCVPTAINHAARLPDNNPVIELSCCSDLHGLLKGLHKSV